jgi:hypothetical protein
MPGGSVTKIGRTYKKMDIHSKGTKHTTHEKAARTSHEKTAYLTKFHSTVQVQRTEYTVQLIEYKIQNTEKQQHTQKQHENKDSIMKLKFIVLFWPL